MRISDWSSDVCSSDLGEVEHEGGHLLSLKAAHQLTGGKLGSRRFAARQQGERTIIVKSGALDVDPPIGDTLPHAPVRDCRLAKIGRASCRERVGPYV